MKQNLFYIALVLFISASGCCKRNDNYLHLGKTMQIISDNAYCYSFTLKKSNTKYIEFEINASYDEDYYFYDSHDSNPIKIQDGYYDLAIHNASDSFQYCLVNDETNIPQSYNAGGPFYGTKITFDIMVDESTISLMLYYSKEKEQIPKISLKTTKIMSPTIVKANDVKENNTSHIIEAISIRAK